MEDTNTKKATTVGAYAEDVEFVNSIKGDGRKQADALAEIVADYRRRRGQTAGQGAAEAAVRLIEAQAAKLCEMVEGVADVAAGELSAARDAADERVAEAADLLDRERAAHSADVSDLRDALAKAVADAKRLEGVEGERDRLQSRLDEAESDVRKAVSTSEAARAGESAAKAKTAELQERLTAAVEARAAAEEEASGLRARLADAENSAKIAEVEFAARAENLATQLETARADAEHGRGNVAFLSSQADDLRRQLDEARRENGRLRAQLDAREGDGR